MAGGSSHIFAFPPSPGIHLSLSNCSDYGMVGGALRGLGNPSMTVQGCFVFVLVFFPLMYSLPLLLLGWAKCPECTHAEGALAVKCLGLFCRVLCRGALLARVSKLSGVLPPCWGFLGLLLFLICCSKTCSQTHLLFFTKAPPHFFLKDAVKLHFLRFMVDLLRLTLLPNLNTQQQEGLNATMLTQCQRPL